MSTKYLSSLVIGFGLAFSVTMPANALTSSFSTGAIADDSSTSFTTGTTASGTPTSLFLDLSHQDLSDLEIFITAPSGDILSIATVLSGSGQITPTLIDSGSDSIDIGVFPYNDNFRPDESGFAFSFSPTVLNFAAFGVQPEGVYTLTINDLISGNTGTLTTATLNFDPAVPVPFEFSPAIGLGALGVAFGLKKLISKVKK